MIRKATLNDVDKLEALYEAVHDAEEAGKLTIGWKRGIYPTRETVLAGLDRDDLYVQESDGDIVAVAVINQIQVPEYVDCKWEYDAPDEEIMVLHTLAVDPAKSGNGYAKKFVKFYEEYALAHGCKYLRMDTNKINKTARNLYKGLGYNEPGIVECVFNGIEGVQLICLEKVLF